MIILALLLSAVSAVKCDDLEVGGVYTAAEAFECINSVEYPVEYNEQLVGVVRALLETYVYKDIVKNPPQPFAGYHKLTDIDARLDAIDVTNTKTYQIYQQLLSIIFDTQDLHLALQLSSNENYTYFFDSMYYYLPFNILVEGDKKCFMTPQKTTHVNVTVPEIFEKNKDVEVKSIDGMAVLEWVRKFANEKTALKSPHGRFTYALESFNYGVLKSNPFDEEFLAKDIVIEWTNGDKITVNYQLFYLPATVQSERSQMKLNLRSEGKVFSPLKIGDTELLLEGDEQIGAENNTNVFDIESEDKTLGCKTYNDKKINLMVLKTFYPMDDTVRWFKKMAKCVELFDSNDYPIALILPLNGGGMLDLESNVENILNIHADTSIIGSVRVSEGSDKCLRLSYGTLMSDPETCEKRYNNSLLSHEPLGEWYTDAIKTMYGDVEHLRSHPSVIPPRDFVSERLVKNPRKPTDIVVFTDGFCYSACSLLTKGLRERGNAIIVGFEGDPEGKNVEFDAGQSPTAVISSLYTLTDDAVILRRLGGVMTISFYESYRYKYDYMEENPREFLTDPIDERVNIYRYEEGLIDTFADRALEIVSKYKTECDPNNKRLVLYSDECESQIGIKHAHGGYVCGDDGKWTKTCVAAYCDTGYKFDYENQKCIVDACFPPETLDSSSIEPEDELNVWIIVGCSIGGVVLFVILLALGLTVFFIAKKKNTSAYHVLE